MTYDEQKVAEVTSWPGLVWNLIQSNPTVASLAPFLFIGLLLLLVRPARRKVAGFFRSTSGAAKRATISAATVAAVMAAAVPGVKLWEGEVLQPYYDVVGVKTVCFGETKGVENRTYTPQECAEMLESRLVQDYYLPMLACSPRLAEMPEGAQAMLLSTTYNIGVGGFCGSSMARAIREGDWPLACEKILLWDKGRVNGVLQRIQGLVNRRHWERDRCIAAVSPI